jgi:hypothetical protein
VAFSKGGNKVTSDPRFPETILLIVLLIVFLDTVFLGVTVGSVLRLFGLATWYRPIAPDETVLYQFRGGATYGAVGLWGLTEAIISDRRFIVRILWSRIALIDVPIGALRRARPGRWWWYRTVVIEWGTTPQVRSIRLGVTKAGQSQMLDALQRRGARVER